MHLVKVENDMEPWMYRVITWSQCFISQKHLLVSKTEYFQRVFLSLFKYRRTKSKTNTSWREILSVSFKISVLFFDICSTKITYIISILAILKQNPNSNTKTSRKNSSIHRPLDSQKKLCWSNLRNILFSVRQPRLSVFKENCECCCILYTANSDSDKRQGRLTWRVMTAALQYLQTRDGSKHLHHNPVDTAEAHE